MEIGMVGMGTMGAGMARRLVAEHIVLVYDADDEAVQKVVASGASPTASLSELVDQLNTPRIVWLMLPAGAPTERTVGELSSLLDSDDIVVDGGNSHYRDSARRAEALATSGIHMLDVGTSGGLGGAEHGYALMIGGSDEVILRLNPIFEALAADPQKSWGRVGANGAGHFAKMVHNGVEYGLKRAYAQGLSALEGAEDLGFDLCTVTDIWRFGAMARSAILDLTHEALTDNPELGSLAPYVADVDPNRRTKQHAVDQIAQRGYDRDQFAS
ncbi:NADP-dependent phosphogluconate dehydrogenase [Gemmatimonadota bacterium]